MKLNIQQQIICGSLDNINNLVIIKKTCETEFVPRIDERIYNYMWKEDVETKIVDVCYDVDAKVCDILLEKRVTENTKEDIDYLAKMHGWETL